MTEQTKAYSESAVTAKSLRILDGAALASRVDRWRWVGTHWLLPRTGHTLAGARPPRVVRLTRWNATRLAAEHA